MNRYSTLVTSVLIITASLSGLHAQEAVLTSGAEASGAGGSMSYSVGQATYINFSGETGSISLGVQQPFVVIMVGTNDPEITIAASVSPNPTATSVNLSLDDPNSTINKSDLTYELYNLTGQLLLHDKIIANKTTLSMVNLTNGMYLLHIRKANSDIRTFKIFKTN